MLTVREGELAARTQLRDQVQDELKRAQSTLAEREAELIRYWNTCYSREAKINALKNNMEDALAEISANRACISQVEAAACQRKLVLVVTPTGNKAAPPIVAHLATYKARIDQLETDLAAMSQLYGDVMVEAQSFRVDCGNGRTIGNIDQRLRWLQREIIAELWVREL